MPHRFRPLAQVLVAMRFLTRLPIPFVQRMDPPPLHHAMAAFPVAGAIIGAIVGGVLTGLHVAGLPELFTAAMAIGAGLLLTGALHEDGIADTADGLGGGRDREHRLAIMRDSRIGAYGALALGVLLLARASLFMTLIELPALHTIILLASAAAFSRAMIVDLLWATRPARTDGLSAMVGQPSRNTTLVALAIGGVGAGLGGSWAVAPAAGIMALVAAGIALAIVRAVAMRKIGGQTGDICGAGQVATELAMLAVYAAAIALPSY